MSASSTPRTRSRLQQFSTNSDPRPLILYVEFYNSVHRRAAPAAHPGCKARLERARGGGRGVEGRDRTIALCERPLRRTDNSCNLTRTIATRGEKYKTGDETETERERARDWCWLPGSTVVCVAMHGGTRLSFGTHTSKKRFRTPTVI